jgi:hypothetical protein
VAEVAQGVQDAAPAIARRSTMARFIVFAGFFAFTLGCGGGTRNGGAGGFGNAATLSGDPVGKALDPAVNLTRVIPITVSGSDIAGTSAILGRLTATSDVYSFIAPVTNHGNRRQCFIQTVTFDLLDDAGATIGTQPNGFLTGSVGRLKDGTMHTDSCLDVGETGYLLELFGADPNYEAVASARITLKSSDSDWVAPETAVIPISYSAPVRDKSYTVTVANQGPVTATVNQGMVIYFDDTGTPAYYNFLTSGGITHSSPYNLAPGDTYQLNCDGGTGLWTGNSTKLLVFIDFNVLH